MLNYLINLLPFAVPFAASAGLGLLVGQYRPRVQSSPQLGEPLDVKLVESESPFGWLVLLVYPGLSSFCFFVGVSLSDVDSAPVFILIICFAILAQLLHTGFLGYRTQDRPLLAVGLAYVIGWLGVVSGFFGIEALWNTLK